MSRYFKILKCFFGDIEIDWGCHPILLRDHSFDVISLNLLLFKKAYCKLIVLLSLSLLSLWLLLLFWLCVQRCWYSIGTGASSLHHSCVVHNILGFCKVPMSICAYNYANGMCLSNNQIAKAIQLVYFMSIKYLLISRNCGSC